MRFCSRSTFFFALALAALATPAVAADENLTLAELRALRQLVEAQSKKLEQLDQRVARLSAALEGRPASAPAAVPAHAAGEFQVPAEAPEDGLARHVIVKGENLTTIAKKHGLTPEELQQANKITDPKKLQIGQTLIIPKPAETKPAETPTEKKP